MTKRAPRDGGFTLVEALVSLFVFSLIASGCVLMLMQSVDSQRRVGEAHEALREVQTARALLAADMAQLVMRDGREANGQRRAAFIGGDVDAPLSFVRATAEPDETRGVVTALALVEYRIVDGQVRRSNRANLETVGDAPMSERILFAEASNARFEFFDGAQWTPQWLIGSGGGAAPRAVALIVDLPRYGEVRIEAFVGLGA
jgi:general secretion pathway protein J